MISLAILGPGAVGGFLAGVLARDRSEVVLLGREPTVTQIARNGITVRSPRFGELHARVDARRRLEEPADVLVIATKAPQLDEALERVQATPRVVIPLLNGVDHVRRLRERFDCAVLPGTIRVQAYRESSTLIVQRVDVAKVTLAAPGHIAFEKRLRQAGIDVGDHQSEPDLLWSKLTRLASLALATAAAGEPLGRVRRDAYAAAEEIVPVARALGADIEVARVLRELRELPDAASSSLRDDVDSGASQTELAAISGPIVDGARRHSLEVPTVERLVATIEARIAP